MKPIWFCLTMVLLINFSLASLALADNDQYAVNDVEVNAGGSSPSQARNNAIALAQKNAFIILLGRLSLDAKLVDNFNADAIADMVSSQQITDEKIAGNNYSATLNIVFSESFIKHYLGNKVSDADLSKNAAGPETYLVLPIKVVQNSHSSTQNSLLWEKDNDWRASWERSLAQNKNPVIKVPKGEFDDIAIINSESLNKASFVANYTDFEPMLNKYKADTLMLAYFNFDALENKVNINLKIVKRFQFKQVRLSFVNVGDLNSPELINKVVNKTIEYIASNKSIGEVNNAKSLIKIDVLISNLGDWLTIKNRLENSNIVSQMKINSISKDLVQITVNYNGNNSDIIGAFARSGVPLQKKEGGNYFISILSSSANEDASKFLPTK